MKLLQNLSTDLPEEVVKSLFSIYSPGGHFVPRSGIVEQFWERVTQETFLYNYFKIHLLVQEKKWFQGFSTFSSGGHLVQWRGTV